jgi:hypothetical protein
VRLPAQTPSPGVQASLIRSDPDSSRRSVATYDGWPLYTYVSDISPGVATGQALNLNGRYWYVMQADGRVGDRPSGRSARQPTEGKRRLRRCASG